VCVCVRVCVCVCVCVYARACVSLWMTQRTRTHLERLVFVARERDRRRVNGVRVDVLTFSSGWSFRPLE
jgi:hypothetical protein